jgi:predicted DNA-binding protein
MTETKAANLRLESKAYSLLHYLSSVEGRSKAAIVEDALEAYVDAHRDHLEKYAREIAALAGLTLRGRVKPSRSRAEILASRNRRGETVRT